MARRPAPPPQAPINEALRAHVTSAKFVLTLGATHIAALVRFEYDLRRDRSLEEDLKAKTLRNPDPAVGHPLRRAFRSPGTAGIISRGLVVQLHPYREGEPRDEWTRRKPSEVWAITPAGWAVITLLQQAGIWQEYTDALPAIPDGRAA